MVGAAAGRSQRGFMREARHLAAPDVRSGLSIRDPRQFWAGVLFTGVGLLALIVARGYPLGTAARIGPGYLPICLSLLLLALGAASVWRGLRVTEGPLGPWPLVPLAFVLGSVIAFALLIEVTGLVESSFALIVLCCYRRLLRQPLEVAIIAGVLILFVVLLFVDFLQMPFTVF